MSAQLTDDDVERLARRVAQLLIEHPPPFWVEGEKHYNDHSAPRAST